MTQADGQDPFVGRTIADRFELIERIGQGGMGVVYKARQVSIDRVIAIKMLNQQMARDPNWVQRFHTEAKACSRLRHPNTIRLFDFGQTAEGRLFMAMEFLAGSSLHQVIRNNAPMDPIRVMRVIVQCCASLIEAHGIGIIHRDLKPDNVFLLDLAGSPDFVKVLDFSVAKLLVENEGIRTQAGMVFGTPQYMSPEQGRGAQLDARSDIYALGVLAYEMLTGFPPFNNPNPMSVLHMHMTESVPPLPGTVPPAVRDFVMRSLSKDPSQRDQSASELMEHGHHVLATLGERPPVAPPSTTSPVPGTVTPVPVPVPMPARAPAPPVGNSPQVEDSSAANQKTIIAAEQSAIPAAEQSTIIAEDSHRAEGSPLAKGSTLAENSRRLAASEQKTILAEQTPADSSTATPKTILLGDSEGIVSFARAQTESSAGGKSSKGAAPRTVLLDESEGIVSFAQTGGMARPATNHGQTQQAPSTLFWFGCIFAGVAVGVLAYILVISLGGGSL